MSDLRTLLKRAGECSRRMVECHDQALFWQCRADQAVNSEDAAQRDTAKQEQYLAWVDGNMKQFRGNLATLKELITQIEELS